MSERERGLQRVDYQSMLPVGFQEASEEEKRAIINRLADQDIALRQELMRSVGKSKLAEHDLAVAVEAVQRLDAERKIYSVQGKGETGSGTYGYTIRGGDTKFIIPILAVVGIVILGIVLIMALKK